MGKEAQCDCFWGNTRGTVKVMLESRELILRGGVRQQIPVSEMREVRVDDEALRFSFGDTEVALFLGADTAIRWAKAIATPPPSLAKKLGIVDGARVLVVGEVDDAALAEALQGAQTDDLAAAGFIVARVDDPATLEKALTLQDRLLNPDAPIWFVYRKGTGVPFGDTAVRNILLDRGYIHTKASAVSQRLSATRYSRRRTTGA